MLLDQKLREERDATAMLLGMVYDSWTDSYRHRGADFTLKYKGAIRASDHTTFESGQLARLEATKKDTKTWSNRMLPGRVTGIARKPDYFILKMGRYRR